MRGVLLLGVTTALLLLVQPVFSQGKCAGSACEKPSVPRIIIGCWQLTERYGRAQAVKALMTFAERNFTTFDTADIYGDWLHGVSA